MQKVKFVPFKSFFESDFWFKLSELKLDVDKLSDRPRLISSSFSLLNDEPLCIFDCSSFNQKLDINKYNIICYGKLINKNTIEQFKNSDKSKLICTEGSYLWNLIKSNDCLHNPSLLNYFFILSFADLKKYHFYYWTAYPVLKNLSFDIVEETCSIHAEFNANQVLELLNEYQLITDHRKKSFFVVIKNESNKVQIKAFNEWLNIALLQFKDMKNIYFAFADSSRSIFSGWPMRNYLLFILNHCAFLRGKVIKLIGFRIQCIKSIIDCGNSQILTIKLPNLSETQLGSIVNDDNYNWTGWEKNEGKLMPKFVNMRSSMDPIKLAENAVNLNLKLIKWRLMPDINLEQIKETKCLILGAGTLGCAIARLLLAWNIRKISLVDNGRVSFSNPVRQNLYTYEDCLDGGKMKAIAAAENLKTILPGVESKGYIFTIPMPGHVVSKSDEKDTKDSIDILSNLIDTHDVIFLAMDSRESRWLPTLLALKYRKIVINVALGFDSYLVMRYGIRSTTPSSVTSKAIPVDQLGCYFCNDVTAPGNSIRDRTLDQQCTVTRPGVANIAAGLAVELLTSILQHSDGALAPASYDIEEPNYVPHSIRGFLSNMSQLSLIIQKYNNCIACSEFVHDHFNKFGFDFLLKVFNCNKYLEEITGLNNLCEDIDKLEILEISNDEEENEEDYQ